MTTRMEVETTAMPDAYFGGCPVCGRWDEHLNVGRAHWHVCHKHRTKSWWGENLVSSWRGQSPGEWAENADTLAEYIEVRPVYPAIPPDVAAAMSRLTSALGDIERREQERESEGENKQALLVDAELVQQWLKRMRTCWIQFVEPGKWAKAWAGEAD